MEKHLESWAYSIKGQRGKEELQKEFEKEDNPETSVSLKP